MKAGWLVLLISGLSLCGMANAELRGTYATDCLTSEGLSLKRIANFSAEDRFVLRRITFAGTNCRVQSYELTYEGVFEQVDEQKINWTFANIYLTPKFPQVVDYFRQVGLCGYAEWQEGVPRNVSGLTCGAEVIPAAGTTYYDIYWEKEGVGIRFGEIDEQFDGTTPEARPTEFSRVIYYRL
jgi:hypothetical protein